MTNGNDVALRLIELGLQKLARTGEVTGKEVVRVIGGQAENNLEALQRAAQLRDQERKQLRAYLNVGFGHVLEECANCEEGMEPDDLCAACAGAFKLFSKVQNRLDWMWRGNPTVDERRSRRQSG